jgi:biotin synthase
MCYAIPGKIIRFENKMVVVDYFGQERKAYNEIDDLEVGDYIYVQGGYAIHKIPHEEAQSILSVWKETFFELQEVDVKLSRLSLKNEDDPEFIKLLDRIMEGSIPSKKQMLRLLSEKQPGKIELIRKAANFLRQKHLGNSCCIHGIIEISNICTKECQYCGISLNNKQIKRYRMSPDEIIDTAVNVSKEFGFKALVLQSGDSETYAIDELCQVIRTIKERAPMLICISFGEVGLDNLAKLYTAGARALLMRFETSNKDLYDRLHPGQNLANRLAHLKKARELGYLIMTGGLIGLPGQTDQDLIEDIMLTKKLGAEMASFGPFIPHPQTPLAHIVAPEKDKMLQVLTLMRFYDPENAKILVTTAFETLDANARKEGLLAGANSVMINVTPLPYRKYYSIYPNRAHADKDISTQINETLAILRSLGRAPTDLGAT